jgi:molecular chaperone GrpE
MSDTKHDKNARKRADELRSRLAELASDYESTASEMDAVQAELAELGIDDDGQSIPSDAEAPLRDDLAQLKQSLDESEERYRRVLADFSNYQRRSSENERRAREAGKAGVLEQMVAALDTFDLALKMNPETTSPKAMLQGVEMIRGEMLRLLASQGFTALAPNTNEPFDPHRHEAVAHAEADGVEPGHIVELVQQGYALGDRVLRPAKVTVRPGDDSPRDEQPADEDNAGANEDTTDANV